MVNFKTINVIYYYILDFYCQTENGLKKDMKDGGIANFDPWEDMEEDVHFIKHYLFPRISLNPKEYALFKLQSNYIARFLCESSEPIKQYMDHKKDELTNFVNKGWSPFSLKGIQFQCGEIENFSICSDLIQVPKELDTSILVGETIYKFS